MIHGTTIAPKTAEQITALLQARNAYPGDIMAFRSRLRIMAAGRRVSQATILEVAMVAAAVWRLTGALPTAGQLDEIRRGVYQSRRNRTCGAEP